MKCNVCERGHARPCKRTHAGAHTHVSASNGSPRCRCWAILVVGDKLLTRWAKARQKQNYEIGLLSQAT